MAVLTSCEELIEISQAKQGLQGETKPRRLARGRGFVQKKYGGGTGFTRSRRNPGRECDIPTPRKLEPLKINP